MKYCLLLIILLISTSITNAQTSTLNFEYGKDLLSKQKYEQAFEVFKTSLTTTSEEMYFEYACYYAAYSAFKLNNFKEVLLYTELLFKRSPQWDRADHAYLLAAAAEFNLENNEEAVKYTQLIKNPDIKKEAKKLKKSKYNKMSFARLQYLEEKYPKDEALLETIYAKIASLPAEERSEKLYNQLRHKLGLDKGDLPTSNLKGRYKVAIIFSFMLNEIDVNNTNTNFRSLRNQFIYDIYQGIVLAAAKLNETDTLITLSVYDVDRDTDKTNQLIESGVLYDTDLIIGPLYPTTVPAVKQYALSNNIAMINPISTNKLFVENNPSNFLLYPSIETQSRKTAQYAVQQLGCKQAYILHGGGSNDKPAAESFKAEIMQQGVSVRLFRGIELNSKSFSQLITDISPMATDTAACLYVSSNEMPVAMNVVGALQNIQSKVPVFVDYTWLDFNQLKYNQLESSNFYFIYPQFELADSSALKKEFYQNYINTTGLLPSKYAVLGFEAMYLFGSQLIINGKETAKKLKKETFLRSNFFAGYDFVEGNDNQVVPILKFNNGKLEVVTGGSNLT